MNQLINTPLKPLKRTKDELLEQLNMPDLPSVIIFDQEAHHLWKIDTEATKEVLSPLEKLYKSTQNDSVVTRPRERYFAERKLKWLEPELKKWKEQHETLKKFRKVQLNKSANAKMAKLKRNTRRYVLTFFDNFWLLLVNNDLLIG